MNLAVILASFGVIALVTWVVVRARQGEGETELFSPLAALEAAEPTSWDMFSTINPQDESTWPSGDKIWNVCHAIAKAEGYNVPNSVPARLNNPGDLSDGAGTFGYEEHSGSHVTHFPNAETGWNWLYDKIDRIVNGQSSVYGADWTWTQIAQKWAGNWTAWAANVTRNLGVSPDSTLASYLA
jgi:hypothetical protein